MIWPCSRSIGSTRGALWPTRPRSDLTITTDRDSVIAAAVPGAIEQILDNLLDNAIGVAPAGSTVTVTVIAGTTTHRLVVTDHGPGLSDDDKERATRRFWRGDTSRPGSGLGLAIAASLARASGGSLSLADAPSGGLAVMVDLPRGQQHQMVRWSTHCAQLAGRSERRGSARMNVAPRPSPGEEAVRSPW